MTLALRFATILFLLAAAMPPDARAAATIFKVTASGAQEVPPNGSAATATAVATYESTTRLLRWSIAYAGLTSAATAAHFHGNAVAGVNAPVKVTVTGVSGTSGYVTGSATVEVADEAALLGGQWYLNIHSATLPGGEVRAQLVSPVTSVAFDVYLEGGQEVPPTQAPGGGSGTAVVDTAANTVTLNLAFSGMSGTLTGAHLHGPAARGVNAAVKASIGTTSPVTTVANYLEADEPDILHGLWYANLHTAGFPGGEVRGQLDLAGPGPKMLAALKNGSGTGTITSSPAGIDCGATCFASFPHNQVVTITAVPDAGSHFGGWGGYCSGNDPACQLTMNIVKNGQARFFKPVFHGDASGVRRAALFWREASPSTGVSWWTMDGATVTGTNYYSVPADWFIADANDIGGDGKADIIWRNGATGATFAWGLNGLALSSFYDLGILDPSAWTLAGTGDLDFDGRADIVWRYADGTVYAWLMNGGVIASQGVVANPGPQWAIADVADMNGDGKSDIVFRNTSDGGVYVYLMNGLSIASGGFAGIVDPVAWTLAGAADFSGDGKADLLWRHASGDTWVWLMNGAAFQSAGGIGNPGEGWGVRSLGDFDGDGKADIVWRHADGTTYLWTMNGASVTSFLPVANPAGTWQVFAP